jgi:hypothetical protein
MVLAQSAAALAASSVPPLAAHAGETIRDVAIRLTRENEPNVDEFWATHRPLLEQNRALTTISAMALYFTAAPESGTEYLWIRKDLPNAPPGTLSIVTAFKIPEGAKGFGVSLPVGSYVACAYSAAHGLYESPVFRVGAPARAAK